MYMNRSGGDGASQKETTMKTRTTSRDTRTAAQAYEENMTAIEALLKTLTGQLAEHKAKQATAPRDWGYTGDLAEVRSRLETTVSFLANDEE